MTNERAASEHAKAGSRSRVACSFDAGPSRRAALSWAQQYMWHVVTLPGNEHRLDFFMKIRVEAPLPVPAVMDALRTVVERNPTLRTGIFAGPGGEAHQCLAGSGTIPAEVIEFSCSPESSAVTDSLPQVSEAHPVAIVLAVVAGLVEHVAVRLSHTVTDEWGFQLLERQFEAQLNGNGGRLSGHAASGQAGDTPRLAGKSSADRAAFESSDAGKDLRSGALEYAAEQLRSCPQTMFPHPPLMAQSPRYWNISLRSAAVFAALSSLASGSRLMLTTPIVGAFASIMALRASLPAALVYVGSSNRFSRDWQDFTGPLFQEAMICVPVRTTTLRDLFAELNGKIPRMYRNGQHDPVALRDRIREIELARGICLDKIAASAMVNIIPYAVRGGGAPVPPGQGLSTLAQASELTRAPRAVADNLVFFVDVFIKAPDVILAARADTQVVSLPEAEAILYGLEKVLCTVAEGDVPMDQLAPLCPGISPGPGDGTVEVDHSRISLADCRAAVNAVPGVHDSHVRLAGRAGQRALTAYVHVARRDLTVARLHRQVVSALAPQGRAMAPHHYRVYGTHPAVLDDVQAWDRAELISEGSGRQ
jgi:hypothetical protein